MNRNTNDPHRLPGRQDFVDMDGLDRAMHITRVQGELVRLISADLALRIRGVNFDAQYVHLDLSRTDNSVTIVGFTNHAGTVVTGFDQDLIDRLQVEFATLLRLDIFAAEPQVNNADVPTDADHMTFDVVAGIVGALYADIARTYRAGGKTLKQLAAEHHVSMSTVKKALNAARLGGPHGFR